MSYRQISPLPSWQWWSAGGGVWEWWSAARPLWSYQTHGRNGPHCVANTYHQTDINAGAHGDFGPHQDRPTHIHTNTIERYWLPSWIMNTVYFLLCLILWCKCSVPLRCGVWAGGVFLDFWVGQRRFSIRWTVTFSPSFTSCVFGGTRFLCYLSLVKLVTEKLVLLELITSTFLTTLCPCGHFIPILSCFDDATCV